MPQIELSVEKLRFKWNSKRLVIIPLGLLQAERPHLTFFFEPADRGPNRGRYWPHVTFSASSRRIGIGAFTPEQFSAFTTGVDNDIRRLWKECSVEVDLDELTEAGWLVFMPSEDVLKGAFDVARWGTRRYRVDESMMQALLEECWRRDDCFRLPCELTPEDVRHTPVEAIPAESGREAVWLGHYPAGSVMGSGWYATAHDWLTSDMKTLLLSKHGGTRVLEACEKAAVYASRDRERRDRRIVNGEIAVMNTEIGIVNAEIGYVNGEIAERERSTGSSSRR